MKDITPKSFTQSMKDFFASLEDALRRACREISEMSWAGILIASVLLALVLTIIPLAIFLFAVLMLVKFAIAAFAKPRRLPPPTTEGTP